MAGLDQRQLSHSRFPLGELSKAQVREIAENHGAEAFLIEDADGIPERILQESSTIGVTAGASTPEYIMEKIIAKLQQAGFSS